MTGQLRDLITGLERRVTERTEALQRQALQLETSAQVSRQATSILNNQDLLDQVVELIRDLLVIITSSFTWSTRMEITWSAGLAATG